MNDLAADLLMPAFLDRLDALGVDDEDLRAAMLQAVDALLDYVDAHHANALPSRDDLLRFWQLRSHAIAPGCAATLRRVLQIVGELLEQRTADARNVPTVVRPAPQFSDASEVVTRPHRCAIEPVRSPHAFPQAPTRVATTAPFSTEPTRVAPPFRHEPTRVARPFTPQPTRVVPPFAHDHSPTRTLRPDDLIAHLEDGFDDDDETQHPHRGRVPGLTLEDELALTPQIELRHNHAGWLEVVWRGFTSGADLRFALELATCWQDPAATQRGGEQQLLLNMRGTPLLAAEDLRWMRHWLANLMADIGVRVALVAEAPLLDALRNAHPTAASGPTPRLGYFTEPEAARGWLERRQNPRQCAKLRGTVSRPRSAPSASRGLSLPACQREEPVTGNLPAVDADATDVDALRPRTT